MQTRWTGNNKNVLATTLTLTLLLMSACTSQTPTPQESLLDVTTSGGMLSAAVSGPLAATRYIPLYHSFDPPAAIAKQDAESNLCPSLLTPSTSGLCEDNAADTVWMLHPECAAGKLGAKWHGNLKISTLDSSSLTCGTWSQNSLAFQYVRSHQSVEPWYGYRTSVSGVTVGINHETLSNFLNDTKSPTIGTGYGVVVNMNQDDLGNSVRATMEVNEQLFSNHFNYTFMTDVPLAVTEIANSNHRMVNGSVIVYNNNEHLKGTAYMVNVDYDDNCPTPISGHIHTDYGTQWERVTFLSCGIAFWESDTHESALINLEHVL